MFGLFLIHGDNVNINKKILIFIEQKGTKWERSVKRSAPTIVPLGLPV
jgi:hypothetical protein